MNWVPWGDKPRVWKGISTGACAALLVLFGAVSYLAILGKSATYDEPLHVVGGFVHRTRADFRINPEDPALFGYWSSLAHPGRDALNINTDLIYWDRMLGDFSTNQWPFVAATLYRTPGNDGDAFLQRSRFMFVLVGAALGAVIACWSWQIGGALAAFFATALFALDPNFMAHAALVKNDVMLSLAMTVLAFAMWRFGRQGSWLSLVAIALACAAAVNIKFSGVLAGPILLLGLLIRTLLPRPWIVAGIICNARWKRLIVVPAVCAIAALIAYLAIWMCYDFRFAPTNNPKLLLDTNHVIELARTNRFRAQHIDPTERLTQEMYDRTRPGALIDLLAWIVDKQLLPQAWLHGFMYTYATTQVRGSYLMGEVRITGWWYYFPCAMLFKTPTATLGAIALALLYGLLRLVFRRRDPPSGNAPVQARFDAWTLLCLVLPALLYLGSAMSSNLNLGLRHVLPVYPFLLIGLGVALASLVRKWKSTGITLAAMVVIGLAAESLPAYPNFIDFFNTPSGGWRGGLNLLGDSNLDWGQDLKLLSRWQQSHQDKPLYLAYFGVADPRFYHVDAINTPPEYGGWQLAPIFQAPMGMPSGPSYFAISATSLQGIYINVPQILNVYRQLRAHEPAAILGGSIYIYDLPLRSVP